MDIKNAFLHGDLQEKGLYEAATKVFEPTCLTHVCKLIKSIWSKTSTKSLRSKFTSYLLAIGFHGSMSENSLIIKNYGIDILYFSSCKHVSTPCKSHNSIMVT